jgi:hypothetical protein
VIHDQIVKTTVLSVFLVMCDIILAQ